ncbi:MAG: hypothetical protein Q9159_005326 [Coniocarpon cinnabarinum]
MSSPLRNSTISNHERGDSDEVAPGIKQVFSNPPDTDAKARPQARPPDPEDTDAFRNSFKRNPKGSWHQNFTVDWKTPWKENTWDNGRVLMVDYMRWNPSKHKAGTVKILAKEIQDHHGLQEFYADTHRCKQAALRVIHVQNAPWAVKYLMHKYNVISSDDLVGSDFGKWVKFDQPEWRAGKPLLKGKTWRTQRDPWRGIRRTCFGTDYLRANDTRTESRGDSHLANSDAGRDAARDDIRNAQVPEDHKLMELNCYDDADAPCYGWDVNVQRLSVYIQFSEGEPQPPKGVKNPYYRDEHMDEKDVDEQVPANGHVHKPKLPPFEALDNGNTIIVFENSPDKSVTNTLIGARQQIESRWRRLSFYLPQEDVRDDARLALECMDLILEDIFKGLGTAWEQFLNIAETHIAILEDKIYDSPADESRAPELWYNSSAWLKVERLCFIHLECVKELQTHLDDLPNRPELQRKWLDGVTEQFDKLTTLVQEDLTKPTTNLSDLMYKSVEIRDSRQSLGLETSMWRLSWITFIFLPLTFIVGFFGMNVDTFSNDPSIKWYFASAIPLMFVVLILWYVLKHSLASRKQTPYQRGVYEHLYHDLATQNSQLWSRAGPRRDVQPIGFYSRLRWWFLRRWFDPRRTIAKPTSDPDEDVGGSGLGAWARCKRMLARKWLGTIDARRRPSISESEEALTDTVPLSDVVATSTAAGTAETVPAVARLSRQNLDRLSLPASGSPRTSARPSSSGGSSGGLMVEERDVGERRASLDGVGVWSEHGGVRRSIDGLMETFGVGAL